MKALLFGVSLLLSCGASIAQAKLEKPLEFNIYNIRIEPRVTALIEKLPQAEKKQATLDPAASFKNTIILSNHWREGGAEFDAGFRLNSREQFHFKMKF